LKLVDQSPLASCPESSYPPVLATMSSYPNGSPVILPGLDVDLEHLVEVAMSEFKQSTKKDMIDDTHHIPQEVGGLPVKPSEISPGVSVSEES